MTLIMSYKKYTADKRISTLFTMCDLQEQVEGAIQDQTRVGFKDKLSLNSMESMTWKSLPHSFISFAVRINSKARIVPHYLLPTSQ